MGVTPSVPWDLIDLVDPIVNEVNKVNEVLRHVPCWRPQSGRLPPPRWNPDQSVPSFASVGNGSAVLVGVDDDLRLELADL